MTERNKKVDKRLLRREMRLCRRYQAPAAVAGPALRCCATELAQSAAVDD